MIADRDELVITEESESADVAVFYTVGGREEQQDCFGYELKPGEVFVSLCDGMGGHQGGRLASRTAVEGFLKAYNEFQTDEDAAQAMIRAAVEVDQKVASLTGPDGAYLHGGTTCVNVFVRQNLLHWASVGDSRGYLIRGEEHVQFTKDQNYKTVLDEQIRAGVITQEEYAEELKNGEALINFLGIGNLSLVDSSAVPIPLLPDDKIIIMSDGLYKTVSEEEIFRIIDNFGNIGEALRALEAKAKRNARVRAMNRDNMTAVLVRIKGGK